MSGLTANDGVIHYLEGYTQSEKTAPPRGRTEKNPGCRVPHISILRCGKAQTSTHLFSTRHIPGCPILGAVSSRQGWESRNLTRPCQRNEDILVVDSLTEQRAQPCHPESRSSASTDDRSRGTCPGNCRFPRTADLLVGCSAGVLARASSRPAPERFHRLWVSHRATYDCGCLQPSRSQPGAPHLDLEMWASTNLNPSLFNEARPRVPHPWRSFIAARVGKQEPHRPCQRNEDILVGKHKPQPISLQRGTSPGCPILGAVSSRQGWESRNLTRPCQPGAPHLAFEMWESTNLNPSLSI